MNTGWRARLFFLTRSTAFLWKGVGLILAVSVAITLMITATNDSAGHRARHDDDDGEWADEQITAAFRHLSTGEAKPEELADWLRNVAAVREDLAQPLAFDPSQLILGPYDIRHAIDHQIVSSVQRDIFADYARSLFNDSLPKRQEAIERLRALTAQSGEVRFAHEFSGDFYLRAGESGKALSDYLVEANHPDAIRARRMAFNVAVKIEDRALLSKMIRDERYQKEIGQVTLLNGAEITKDRWLAFKMLTQWLIGQWKGWEAVLGLLSASVWYVVLIYGTSAEKWRWLRYLPAVFMGVLSVAMLSWWQSSLHYGLADESLTPTHEIISNVLYVGVPEETVKLMMFACLLPLLVRKRASRAIVALTAGCVGLGFALAENVRYFVDQDVGLALGRLLTANFMHIAMTGLLGLKLAAFFKSRFHKVGEFATAFGMVVLAHGAYDFACGGTAQQLGIGMLTIIILAVLTKHFLHEIRPSPAEKPRQIVSGVSVFVFGAALLIGSVMIVAALEGGDRSVITSTLAGAVGLVPVALLYVREFRDV